MRLAFMAAFLFLMQQRQTRNLDSLVDTKRVLLVFAPSIRDIRFRQQMALVARHTKEMKERDVVLVANLIDTVPHPGGDTLHATPVPYVFDQATLTTRSRFEIKPGDFAVLLLGKDGEEKLRSPTPIPTARLNRVIDAMPMRREEMRPQIRPSR